VIIALVCLILILFNNKRKKTKNMNNDTLYIDIETIPAVEPTKDDLKAPGNYTKQESINIYIEENEEKLMEKEIKERSTSLYDSRILCLSYAWGNNKPQSLSGNEREIIRGLGVVIEKQCQKHGGTPDGKFVVGHNIKKFDAPIIWLKACLYDVVTVQQVFRAKNNLIIDTMEKGTYGIFNKYVSLDKMLKFFNIGSKGAISGEDVYPMWKEGKLAEICRYCNEDVSKTRKLHKKLML
jgi:predicted PolB exonuclease-like 3'-5' exonuclease